MTIPVHFRAEEGRKILEALAEGTPIVPPESGWHFNSMITAAGALLYAASTYVVKANQSALGPDQPFEKREAVSEQIHEDTKAAVEFCCELAELLDTGEYDPQFESLVEASVHTRDGQRKIQSGRGWKRFGRGDHRFRGGPE